MKMPLSSWFWNKVKWVLSIAVVLFVAVRCAKDSSLNLSKIESRRLVVKAFVVDQTTQAEGIKVRSVPEGILIDGSGEAQMAIRADQTATVNIEVAKGWEIVDWEVAPQEMASTVGPNTRSIVIANPSVDQSYSLKVQRIEFVRFEVKVVGSGVNSPGGGEVLWNVYPAGTTDFVNTPAIAYGYCSTDKGFSIDEPRSCGHKYGDKGYPNGSIVAITTRGYKKSNEKPYETEPQYIVLRDHYVELFNFGPDLER